MITGTKYLEIYDAFLSALTDERLANLSEQELQEELLPVLKTAIYDLCRLAAQAGYDLDDRDDVNYHFNIVLSSHEIECLGFLMVVKWTEQQLNSSRLVEQQYYDAGIKTYSPNETMRNLTTLHEQYSKKAKNKLTEYTYKTVPIGLFGGNER